MRRSLATVVLAVLTALALGSGLLTSPASAKLPSERQWHRDVRKVMTGSDAYLTRRAANAAQGQVLAVNFDIDNSMLASEYDRGAAIGRVLRLARHAQSLGIEVVVNTARLPKKRKATLRELRKAGYEIDRICFGSTEPGVSRAERKEQCRRQYEESGLRIVANVGNRSTDFEGGYYDRAYKLPDYRGQLG